MSVILYQVDLPVSDMDRAESFYQQLLDVPNRRESPERHHFDCGEMVLTCYQAGQDQEPIENVTAASHEIFFAVDDLETMFLQAQQAGCASLDEEIINHPWGYRSFAARDPFGNSIVFMDEASMQQQMNERLTAGPDDLFQTNMELSIESLAEDPQHQPIAASVAIISTDEIWIKLAESSPNTSFVDNESVRIRFRVGEEVFLADTTIVNAPSDTGHVAISIPVRAAAQKRRAAPRVSMPIPVSFSIFTSPDSEEMGEERYQTESQEISIAGIWMETVAPLNQGDKLDLELSLPSSETIQVVANVRRTKQIDAEKVAVGLQFVEMQLEDQMKLLQLLNLDVERQPSLSVPEQEEPTTPANLKVDAPEPLRIAEETSAGMDTIQEKPEKEKDILLPVEEPEIVTKDTPAPVEVAEETSAGMDTIQEKPEKEKDILPPVEEPEIVTQDTPAPVEIVEETSAGMDTIQEKPEKEKDILPPVEEPEIVTKDTPAPVEIVEETSDGLDANQKVEAAPENQDIPAPVREQEEIAPIEEEEEEEEEELLLPVVQIVPEVQGRRALLELTNGYHKPLQLMGVLAKRGTHSIHLIEESRELQVDITETLDVTEKLLTLFHPENTRIQHKRFQISLILEPEPLDQPAPASYVLSFSKGGFSQFSVE
jgi:predicted enzyme related to lactoylglutathione lyase